MRETFVLKETRRSDLSEIRAFVQRVGQAAGLTEAELVDLKLAVDEAATNSIVHGYGNLPGPLTLTMIVAAEATTIILEDEAPVFNPLSAPEPDIERPLAQRPPGGFGVYILRQMMDQIMYEPLPQGNRLILVKNRPLA